MTIKIGDKTFATHKPKDLDGELIAATGTNAAETAAALASYPLAGRVASALRPFLKDDAPPLAELAHMIAEHGTTEVAAEVRKLYAGDVVAPAAVPAAKGE